TQKLARITGESMSTAVERAVRERLERVKSKRLKERIMKIAKDAGPRWKEPYRSIDRGDLLYDEKGLPKCSWTPLQSSRFFVTSRMRKIYRRRLSLQRFGASQPELTSRPPL